MTDVTGVVQKIEVRDVAGGKKAYNIVVAGQSYGAGLYAPKCKEGDYVKFELDESRGYKNVGRNSLKVNSKGAPPEAIAEAKATAGVAAVGGKDQVTISKQSATNTAIAYLELAAKLEAVSLPKSEAKGKRLEALDIQLAKYTAFFYEQNTGQKWEEKKVEAAKEEVAAPDDSQAEAAAAEDGDWD